MFGGGGAEPEVGGGSGTWRSVEVPSPNSTVPNLLSSYTPSSPPRRPCLQEMWVLLGGAVSCSELATPGADEPVHRPRSLPLSLSRRAPSTRSMHCAMPSPR